MIYWRLAVAFWAASLLSMLLPGISEASVFDLGEIRFRLSDVLTLAAVGFAWGDLKQWRVGVNKRLDDLEKKRA